MRIIISLLLLINLIFIFQAINEPLTISYLSLRIILAFTFIITVYLLLLRTKNFYLLSYFNTYHFFDTHIHNRT